MILFTGSGALAKTFLKMYPCKIISARNITDKELEKWIIKAEVIVHNAALIYSDVFDDLYNVLVVQHVLNAHHLGVVLSGGSPHERVFELLHETLMYRHAEVVDGRVRLDDHGSLVVGDLTFGLGVDSDEIQVGPDLLHQLVEVPLILG